MRSSGQGRTKAAAAGLACAWLLLSAFALNDPARLDYEALRIEGDLSPGRAEAAPAPAPDPADGTPRTSSARYRLVVDASVLADSNVTNSTDDRTIPIFYGAEPLPVALDPQLRAHGGIGRGLAASGEIELPIGSGAGLLLNAEGYLLDYDGSATDDVSLLIAAGPSFKWGGGEATVQLIGFDRWYGGISATAGLGVRGRYRGELSSTDHLSLSLEARRFSSDYGGDFGGTHAGAYLTYETVLDPVTSGSLGLFARRDWLGEEAYSYTELGAYGGLGRHLGPGLTGSISAGLSRARFDEPVLLLSPSPREDWRFYASASLAARRPLALGLYPSLSYSYGRTWSSIGYFDARRHRVRLGLQRSF
jgi:hypothetical protein